MLEKIKLMLLRILTVVTLLILFFVPGIIWYQNTGNIFIYFNEFILKGQLLYVLSKLLGLYAITFIVIQVIASLLAKLTIINSTYFNLMHRIFGGSVILLSALHILLFFFAASSRQENLAWRLFALDFSDFYTANISLGVLGIIGLLVILVTGVLNVKNKSSFVKKMHKLYWIPICLICIHAVSIGTEFNTKTMIFLYTLLGVIALLLNIIVIMRSLHKL